MADCNCGGLTPKNGENPVPNGTSSDQILSQVQLICDNETGVLFFRYDSRLYMRVVDCPRADAAVESPARAKGARRASTGRSS